MFERQLYKKQAREQLKNHWKLPLLISLIAWGVSECLFLASSSIPIPSIFQLQTYFPEIETTLAFNLLNILLYSPYSIIMLAAAYFYISFIKDNKSTFTTFLEGFALWSKGLRSFLWLILWTILWSLLLIVPGIIKLCAYSQMFFVMADNPKVGVRKAMKISMTMTRWYKGEIFVMALSFIGWILLLAIFPIAISIIGEEFLPVNWATTFLMSFSFIVIMLVQPYIDTSFTYAYHNMKLDAINRKVLTYADFGQDEPVPAVDEPNAAVDEPVSTIEEATCSIEEATLAIEKKQIKGDDNAKLRLKSKFF